MCQNKNKWFCKLFKCVHYFDFLSRQGEEGGVRFLAKFSKFFNFSRKSQTHHLQLNVVSEFLTFECLLENRRTIFFMVCLCILPLQKSFLFYDIDLFVTIEKGFFDFFNYVNKSHRFFILKNTQTNPIFY